MSREWRKIIRSAVYVQGGEWSEELGTSLMGTLKQLIVVPESSDNRYTFALVDEDNMPIFTQTTIGPIVSSNLELPLYPGEKKFVLTGVQKDELFRIKLIYEP